MRFTIFFRIWLCLFFFTFTSCSASSNTNISGAFKPPIIFEAALYSHPLVLNALVRNDTDEFVEFDMAYRLKKFVDGGWHYLENLSPHNFPDRTVGLFTGEWSNAYLQSWYPTHGELAFGKYRIYKTFRYYSEQNGVKYIDLYVEFNISDVNDAIRLQGEVVRFHFATEADTEGSPGLKEGTPILLVRDKSLENLITNDIEILFALWLDAAIAVDIFGNAISFDSIPIGASIDIILFGHLGLDGNIDGYVVDHLRNVRLVRVLCH